MSESMIVMIILIPIIGIIILSFISGHIIKKIWKETKLKKNIFYSGIVISMIVWIFLKYFVSSKALIGC